MRRLFVTLAGALVLALAGPVGIGSANAAMLGTTAVRTATDSIASIEKTVCWRRGWHGWGWYPCDEAVVVPVPGAVTPVIVAPA